MAYNITLEGKNLEEAERMLPAITEIIEKHKINYWLEGGTLLGIRRENRLLPWDDDIDISLLADEIPKLKALSKELKNKGYRLRERRFKKTCNQFKEGNLRMIKIRERRFFGFLKGKVCLDIFVKYTTNEKSYWEIDNKTKYVPYHFYQNLKTIVFQNKVYPIPEDTDGYLTFRYGDWQTPVKEWNTSTDDKALDV